MSNNTSIIVARSSKLRNVGNAFRNGFGTLILVLLLVLGHTMTAEADNATRAIQGIWFGDTIGGTHVEKMRRTILLVTEVETHIIGDNGVTTLNVSYDTSACPHSIVIQRTDGTTQNGVFEIQEDQLVLTLANPGAERPTGKMAKHTGGSPHAHYVFSRLHTSRGLDLLRKTLANPALLKTLTATSHSPADAPLPVDHPEYNLPSQP